MEQGGKREPSLFVPALARKSIKRRNRVSIVRAHDTRRCVRVGRGSVCAMGECMNTVAKHTAKGNTRQVGTGESKTRPSCRSYLVVNINVFRTLVELIKC